MDICIAEDKAEEWTLFCNLESKMIDGTRKEKIKTRLANLTKLVAKKLSSIGGKIC